MKEERRQQQNLDMDVDRLFQEGFQEKARRLEAEAAREETQPPAVPAKGRFHPAGRTVWQHSCEKYHF